MIKREKINELIKTLKTSRVDKSTGINDYLADIKVSEVKRFEKEFLAFMNSSYPQVKRAIRETGKLEKDTEEFLIDGINAFKKQFEG